MTQKHSRMTDEMIANQRKRIGEVWHPREPFYNTQATKDAIRHFAHGIGDTNPLWTDEGYAKKTEYGSIIAPPLFLMSVYWPGGGSGFPGIHAWHAGNDWEFYRRIVLGDELTYTNTIVDLVEKKSKMAGKSVIQYSDTIFKNQRDEVVAKVRGWSVWAERGASGDKGKYRDIASAKYTREDIQKIYDDYDREEIRGGATRYWEDVKVGDELTPVVKGPLSLRDIIAFNMGAGSIFIRAYRLFLDYQRRHPAIGMIDSATGIVDIPELVHMEKTRAGEIGIPGAYDYGPQRICWLGHLMTNWMGDTGFLKKLYAEIRRFNVFNDTTWLKGRVKDKYVKENEHLVDIECWAENQRGEVTMPGRATVSLPT